VKRPKEYPNPVHDSWLRIIADVHRTLPEVRAEFERRRCPKRAYRGPRKKKRI
jgi:hypothetical protein